MQLVIPPHHRQIGRRDRPSPVVEAASAQLQERGLPRHRKLMLTVDHRFALSRPALLRAPPKKSLFSASSPSLACSVFKSTAGLTGWGGGPVSAAPGRPAPKLGSSLGRRL